MLQVIVNEKVGVLVNNFVLVVTSLFSHPFIIFLGLLIVVAICIAWRGQR